MTMHTTGTREEWLAARLELLAAEKELSRRRRGRSPTPTLPWVPSTRTTCSTLPTVGPGSPICSTDGRS